MEGEQSTSQNSETQQAKVSTSVDTSSETQVQDQGQDSVDTEQSSSELNEGVTKDVVLSKPEPEVEKTQEDQGEPQVDFNELIQSYIDNSGELSKKELAQLKKSGLTPDNFKLMAEGQKAVQEKNNNTLFELVGGKESYLEMQKFAGENLSEAEINAFNLALRSNNMNLAKMATLGLQALYKQQQTTQPASKRITGDSGVTQQAVGAYESQQELINDLNNPKYGVDPDFTETVNSKRSRSKY